MNKIRHFINKNKIIIGHVLALFTIIVWGTTFIATKVLLNNFTPVEILFFRFLIAFVALFITYPKIFKYTNIKDELLFFAASLSGITIYQFLENTALTYSSASNVSIITACAAFFTAIFSKIFLKDEKITKLFYVGFIVSMIGVVLVSFNGTFSLDFVPAGDLMSLCGAVLWGVYSVVVKVVSKKNYNPVHVTRRIMMYGLISLIPICLFTNSDLTFSRFLDIDNLLLMLFLGLIASALCFSTWNISVDYLGAVKTGMYVYFNPVVTIIFGAIILNEKLSLMGIVGTILIFVGLYVSSFKRKKEVENN